MNRPRLSFTRVRLLATAAIASAVAADAAPGRGLKLSSPRGGAEIPGVIAITGDDAPDVSAAWFGAAQSPAVAPWAGPGVSVAVPPGEEGRQVTVRVRFRDGRERRVGRFAYDGLIRAPRRDHATGSGRGCWNEVTGKDWD